MAAFKQVSYDPDHLDSFDREWLCHKGISEWWYATGHLNDETNHLYSFQYTLVRALVYHVRSYILMLAITDIATGKHYFVQQPAISAKGIMIASDKIMFRDLASLKKETAGFRLKAESVNFAYDLFMDYGKGPFWHCDNGKLQMGIADQRATTLYYSYPNMPVTGTITLEGIIHNVKGKAWLDKQGGSYPLTKPECMWEWFSLRFFDDEEMMLFSFPQDDYIDGTYIRRNKTRERLNRYTVTPLKFTTVKGYKFSCEWEVELPGLKAEHYFIRPLTAGQLNIIYFELLAGIYRNSGELVGYCMVELLPGVYNGKISPANMFRKLD